EPQSAIPVFVKSGAIIPLMAGNDARTLCDDDYGNNPSVKTWDGGLEVRIYPSATCKLTMFGGTEVIVAGGNGSQRSTIKTPTPRTILLRVHGPAPAAVRVGDAVVPEVSSPGALETTSAAWAFDATLGFVSVKLALAAGTSTITL